MKVTLLIIGFILTAGLICILPACKNKSQSTAPSIDRSLDSVVKDNHYMELRKLAFDITPQQLGLTPAETEVYAVIMDQDLGKGILTLITYKTGDASIYLSSGRGQVGGGQHTNVNQASKAFIELSKKYLDKATKTDPLPFPDKGCTRFYFLTPKGTYSMQESNKNLETRSSPLLGYFDEANKVIKEMRIVAAQPE
jgi:hypothetical protein